MIISNNQKEKQPTSLSRTGYESYGIPGILHSDQKERPLRHIHEKAIDNRVYVPICIIFLKKHTCILLI